MVGCPECSRELRFRRLCVNVCELTGFRENLTSRLGIRVSLVFSTISASGEVKPVMAAAAQPVSWTTDFKGVGCFYHICVSNWDPTAITESVPHSCADVPGVWQLQLPGTAAVDVLAVACPGRMAPGGSGKGYPWLASTLESPPFFLSVFQLCIVTLCDRSMKEPPVRLGAVCPPSLPLRRIFWSLLPRFPALAPA